ncbi:GlsB/YeaQ/YmgE family stress response membrane protein [Streptococcus sp. H31]|uniref:GlsB/YeaQ/YmgE family stress response membrane protein n=1 Tax=Streptococcus huangxiaojuni TaxID=3237239 RepID=UPI0034A59653
MIMLWSIIIGALIGVAAGALTKEGGSMGWIANIAAGLIGSAVGQALFGTWGPSLAGMALVPSILGAVIVVTVAAFFLNRAR